MAATFAPCALQSFIESLTRQHDSPHLMTASMRNTSGFTRVMGVGISLSLLNQAMGNFIGSRPWASFILSFGPEDEMLCDVGRFGWDGITRLRSGLTRLTGKRTLSAMKLLTPSGKKSGKWIPKMLDG